MFEAHEGEKAAWELKRIKLGYVLHKTSPHSRIHAVYASDGPQNLVDTPLSEMERKGLHIVEDPRWPGSVISRGSIQTVASCTIKHFSFFPFDHHSTLFKNDKLDMPIHSEVRILFQRPHTMLPMLDDES